MASIARLAVDLTLNTGKFRKGLTSANKRIQGFATSTANAAKSVVKYGAALAAAAAGGMAFFIKEQFTLIDQTAKLARTINTTTEALTGLQFAASISGVDVGQLNKSLEIMIRRIGEADAGLGEGKQGVPVG